MFYMFYHKVLPEDGWERSLWNPNRWSEWWYRSLCWDHWTDRSVSVPLRPRKFRRMLSVGSKRLLSSTRERELSSFLAIPKKNGECVQRKKTIKNLKKRKSKKEIVQSKLWGKTEFVWHKKSFTDKLFIFLLLHHVKSVQISPPSEKVIWVSSCYALKLCVAKDL